MNTAPSMQEVIKRLHEYWAEHGCLIWQPYSEKVGAGTMNPATVLRVLGPEPWNVAYVILKPDPGNPQELYLGSLEAIGLDRTRHDIRFVEDNWESPALGAWGLGWEVWLDGQEITQFTYFQQAGSLSLDPVSVEITYGLDRIIMYLQQKTEVWQIDVDGVHTFGEIYRTPEIEHCVYNYELADVERLKTLFDIYHAEAQACIDRGLAIPAYDFVLRQSHTFNLLDSRGAIGVTERAKFFGTMRNQARQVSELYVAQRETEEYPWIVDSGQLTVDSEEVPATSHQPPATSSQSFLFEIGSEELPVQDVEHGISQIEEKLAQMLGDAKLEYGTLKVTGTTRRLVVYVTDLVPRQLDEEVEKRGPALDRAYDEAGNPTKAAQGFARGQGIDPADLEKRDGYIYAVKRVIGRPTAEVLAEICPTLLDGLRWGKTMRWNSSGIGYPRPLRWLLALYGDAVVPFSWAGVTSGRESRKPRYAELTPGSFGNFTVSDSDAYFEQIAGQGIVLNREERRRQIVQMVAKAANGVSGVTPDDPGLLDEVTDLIESPQAVLGSFEEKYLELPTPVLIGVMKKHQRYFPVFNKLAPDKMMPHFITIANADVLAHPDVVQAGNEGVIRARYADAAFFYRQDTQQKLAEFTPNLATLTFHEKLGSMLDKAQRLEKLAPAIGTMLNLSAQDQQVTQQAARLSKSDLVTSMVVEMTSLQGTMGEYYALNSGEMPAVAQAIREHYLPRSAGDANPETAPGLALGLADKLDSLVGLFAVGVVPRGNADPFGLRRAALGVVNNLIATETDFDLREAIGHSAALQPVTAEQEAQVNTLAFLARRLQGVLSDTGYAHDVIEAVLAVRSHNPIAAQRSCEHLSAMIDQTWWSDAFTAYARCARITRKLEGTMALNRDAYQEDVERQLHDAYDVAAAALADSSEPAATLGSQLQNLQGPINAFFDSVMVNAEDETVRSARLALVQRIASLSGDVADLSKLQGF